MKKIIITATIIFTIGFEVMGQPNTSYNQNAVPISGGKWNTAFGSGALSSNASGLSNTATGDSTLYSNISGGNNTANGYQALYSSLASNNTANGYQALFSNTTGSNNTANGSVALFSNTTGSNNIANGLNALYSNTSGSFNTATGGSALFFNNGNFNTATGSSVLLNNTGDYNTANGVSALFLNTSGSSNTAYGVSALRSNAIGNNNVAIGDSAGLHSLGSGNVYLGSRAGYHETGNNKLYIGNDSEKTILYGDMSTGQVLLGNKQPFGYFFKGNRTLNVLGGILADSVRVALSGNWADNIFSDDYKLQPLNDVRHFIETYKHLPGIPTTTEVSRNGIDLAVMNSKLLEKVEELTLYILDQQKLIEVQQNTSAIFKKQLELQQKQIQELKRIILK